ncbi:MAG: PAS domain-containing protein [Balneolales bacterium]|nr:PAS domain-containing protein [Balneolales bacterium]
MQKLCGQASNLIKARNTNTALLEEIEDLQKIEEIFTLIQKSNKIGAWEFDVDSGRMVWTPEVYAIHDLPESHQKSLEKDILFYHTADRTKVSEAFQRTITDGTPYDMECRLISAKGRLKWVRITGRPFENKRNRKVIIGSIQDISEKKKAELIRRQEYGFFDSGPVSILMFGIAENWPITYATENIHSLLGYRPEELKDGRFRYLDLIHPDDALVFENFAYELLENHDTEPDITYRFKTATGGYKWIRGISRLIQDSDGVPVAIRAYISDNTIQKESELKLEENEKLLNSFFNQSFTGFFFAMLDEPVKWDDEADKEALLDYVMTHQRITKVNQATLDQYGATEEQFLGLTPSDLFAHDIKHGRYIWRGLFDKGKWHVETRE